MATNSKSPADLKKEGEELKALFAKVKKKQHNCALLMSKDGIVVEAHIKKSPDILFKAAKKNGGMPKGVWGTMTMDGQVIIVDPINEKIPGNLTKLAKKFFAARGLKFRLEILEPEEDAAPMADASAPEEGTSQVGGPEDGSAEAADGGDQKQELESKLAEMQDDIDTLQADTENVMHSALQDALSAHQRAMDAEDFDRGASTLNTLKVVLEDYEGLMVEKRPLLARMQAMAAAAERVKGGDDSDAADQIGRAMREFDYALSNNEWIGAAEKLDAIEALTQAHRDEPKDEEPNESAGDTDSGTPSESGDDPSEPTETTAEDLQSRFGDLIPNIRAVAAIDDPALKKKLAVLVKGFKTEIAKGDLGKCQKIMTLLEQLIEDAMPTSDAATSEDAVSETERENARNKIQTIDTEIGDIEAEMDALEAALSSEMETAT